MFVHAVRGGQQLSPAPKQNNDEPSLHREDIVDGLKLLLAEFAETESDDADKDALTSDIDSAMEDFRKLCEKHKKDHFKQKHAAIIEEHKKDHTFDKSLNPVPNMSFLPRTTGLERIFEVLERPSVSYLGKYISIFVLLVITISVTAFCIETDEAFTDIPPECHAKLRIRMLVTEEDCRPVSWPIFTLLETICIILFTVEYIPRILLAHTWTYRPPDHPECDPLESPPSWYLCDPLVGKPFQGPWRRTLSYALEPLNIVDFLAIFPWYLEHIAPGVFDGQVLRVVRLLRVVRIFKLGKSNSTFSILGTTIKNSLPALYLLLFFNIMLMILFGALIYLTESSEYRVDSEWVDYDCSNYDSLTGGKCIAGDLPTGPSIGTFVRPTFDRHDGFEASPFTSIPESFWCALCTVLSYY
jgi:hypothetical protein